jgi:hypothetical protein
MCRGCDVLVCRMDAVVAEGVIRCAECARPRTRARRELPRFLPFEEARAFARGLGLKTVAEWRAFSNGRLPDKGARPTWIPGNPVAVYEEWRSWGDWLGTGTVANGRRAYRPFEEARAFVRGLGLVSREHWTSFVQGRIAGLEALPTDVPRAPHMVYRETWQGWGDWLGNGALGPGRRAWRPFEAARTFARGLRLASEREWRAFASGELPGRELPADIPASPHVVYASEWGGYDDWLGAERPRRRFRSFERARELARSLGLRDRAEWDAWARGALKALGARPTDVPADPDRAYRGRGWRGFEDWLGLDGARAVSIPQGTDAEKGAPVAGRLYLATDTCTLYVGVSQPEGEAVWLKVGLTAARST